MLTRAARSGAGIAGAIALAGLAAACASDAVYPMPDTTANSWTVGIAEDGKLTWNGAPVTLPQLGQLMKSAVDTSPDGEPLLTISAASDDVRYRDVIVVAALAQDAGMQTKVGIAGNVE